MRPFVKVSVKFILLISFLPPESAYSWGPVGHETIGYIAQDYLSSRAMEKIGEILGDGRNLADISNWADQRQSSDTATKPWHYIDIDVRKNVSRESEFQFCSGKSCITEQINLDISRLKDPASNLEAKSDALKYLVHFIGDLHQPLHCSDDSDRGGNDKIVRFLRKDTEREVRVRLHSLWDRLIEIKTVENPRELATELEKNITRGDIRAWSAGTPEDWAWESYRIAREKIYPDFKPGPSLADGKPLPAGYYSGEMRGIVNVQLRKSGVRLAYILENIFGGQSF